MQDEYNQLVDDAINNIGNTRESCWTESLAVGNREFVKDTKAKFRDPDLTDLI